MADYFAGWKKQQLIRDLAAGEASLEELAERYERTLSWIQQFAGKHQAIIFAIRENPADEIGQLWISRLVDRLAALQADVEAIDARFEEGAPVSARMLEVKLAVLRHAAEVLGQAMPKLYGDGVLREVEYRIVGIMPSEIAEAAEPVGRDGQD